MILRRGSACLSLALLLAAGCTRAKAPVSRVVVVTLDTTRADRLGCYGYAQAATTNLDRLAEESVLFEHAVSPVPTTLAAHGTLFTGLYPQDHGVRYNLMFRFGPETSTLAEKLKAAGFATGAFPASYILARRFGLDQGFGTYEAPQRGGAEDGEEDERGERRAAAGVDLALAWLGDRGVEDKLFLWVHFYDPHAGYAPPFPYNSQFRERPYDGELAYVDAQLGRLLARLRRDDPGWRHTLLVVAGDHGEGLHDHGERWHANLVYETTQHVPLIVRAPGARAGRVAEPVTIADVTPTVLDYAGLAPGESLRGTSLRPALSGRALAPRDLYFESLAGSLNYGWAELHGLRDGRFKLIDSSAPEMYDLDADPGERNNLATLEPERLGEMREALRALSAPIGSPAKAEAAHPVLDAETEAFLNSLGYVGGVGGGSAAGAPPPQRLIDLEPELLAAQGAVGQSDWPRLEEVCRYVLGRDRTNKWALHNLISALLATERGREAQDLGAELIRLYPDNDRSYVSMAAAYRAQKRWDEALAVLQQGQKVVADSPTLAYYELVASFEVDRPTLCGVDVPAATAKYPKVANLRILLARCAARAGNTESALAALGGALDLGFRGLEALASADDMKDVAALPAFKDLLTKERGQVSEP